MRYGIRHGEVRKLLGNNLFRYYFCSAYTGQQKMKQNSNAISVTIPTPVLSGSGSKGSLRISAIKIVNNF